MIGVQRVGLDRRIWGLVFGVWVVGSQVSGLGSGVLGFKIEG